MEWEKIEVDIMKDEADKIGLDEIADKTLYEKAMVEIKEKQNKNAESHDVVKIYTTLNSEF